MENFNIFSIAKPLKTQSSGGKNAKAYGRLADKVNSAARLAVPNIPLIVSTHEFGMTRRSRTTGEDQIVDNPTAKLLSVARDRICSGIDTETFGVAVEALSSDKKRLEGLRAAVNNVETLQQIREGYASDDTLASIWRGVEEAYHQHDGRGLLVVTVFRKPDRTKVHHKVHNPAKTQVHHQSAEAEAKAKPAEAKTQAKPAEAKTQAKAKAK